MNYRDARILRAVREAPCMMCGAQDGTVVYALISPTPEFTGGRLFARPVE